MLIDSGATIGLWTVLREVEPLRSGVSGKARRRFLCRCQCGVEKAVLRQNLRPGAGCFACGRQRIRGLPAWNKRHGESHRTPEHRIWKAIHERCGNRNHVAYARYGGRGIRVCAEWTGPDGFKRFLADMGRRPSREHSIERVDANGDYGPGNCRWATLVEQANNKRSNRRVAAYGETLTIAEWSRRHGVSASLIAARLRLGWDPERAVSEPARLGRNQFG